MLFVLIAAGGGAGAVARYSLSLWVHSWAGSALPWGTLAVNLVGSFSLGLAVPALDAWAADAEIRALITAGFLGAFTTFSTFSFETVHLLQRGAWERAGGYVAASLVLGLLGVAAGLALGHWLLRSSH